MFAPLKGIRVVDLTQVLAGPYATYQLALMGAEVIKVEPTTQGDWTRAGAAVPGHDEPGMGAGYLTQNADKQTLAVDLKSAQGLAIVQQLIASADVFVENFKPGTAARLGLSFEAVRAVNDKILYCSISAYGQDGPISHRPAYDHVVQGMCGIMRSTGTADTEPNKVGAPYIDYATGLNAAFAIVSALLEQRARPRAVRLDVAMLDSSLLLMASMMTQAMTLGMQHRATGNEAHSRSPSSGAFATTDGMLMIAANNERQFRDLCRALGHPEWLDDERWATPQARVRHADELRRLIEARVRTQSADDWEARLDKASVPAARVRNLNEALAEPQVQARGIVAALPLGVGGPVAHMPTLGFKADGQVIGPRVAPRRQGADTRAILASLGKSAAQIDALVADGVVMVASEAPAASAGRA